MTGQAQFTLACNLLQQPGVIAAMGLMATGAFPCSKRLVNPEKTFFHPDFLVTGKAQL
jgi:hypothetical protein